MMKKLISASLVFMLCGPALAGTAQPTSAVPMQSVRLELAVKSGAVVRKHELVLVDHDCGEVVEKAADHQDEIRLCASPGAGAEVRLSIDWMTHEADVEFHTKSSAVITRGGTFEIGSGALRLAIAAT